MRFSTGTSSINRTFKWLYLKTRQTPQNGQNVHRFQVRTPICHIVPVSRTYVVGGVFPVENKGKGEGIGEGRDRQRNRQVNAQALSKLPFSKLPLVFPQNIASAKLGWCVYLHLSLRFSGQQTSNIIKKCQNPDPPLLFGFPVLFFLFDFPCFWGAFLLSFPKILGVTLREEEGTSKKEKSKEILKARKGGSGKSFSKLFNNFFGAPTPGLCLAKNSAEKTKYVDVSQPPHQGDELKRR